MRDLVLVITLIINLMALTAMIAGIRANGVSGVFKVTNNLRIDKS